MAERRAGSRNEPIDKPNDIQGEGDYAAARRYRKDVGEFLEDADPEKLARDAAPASAKEARELALAEDKGRDRSHGDDPGDAAAMYPGRRDDDSH